MRRLSARLASCTLVLALATGPVTAQVSQEGVAPGQSQAPASPPQVPPQPSPPTPEADTSTPGAGADTAAPPNVPAVDLPTAGDAAQPAAGGDDSSAGATAPEGAAPGEGTPLALPTEDDGGGAVDRSQLPHDLSPWGMFMAADIVVQAVMVGLAVASLAVWTVWVAKLMELMTARMGLRRGLKALGSVSSLEDASLSLTRGTAVARAMTSLARAELELSQDVLDGPGLKERVASRLSSLDASLGRRIRRGMGLLATVGATAPFIGLFGTVWGIMNSFIGISKSQTTSLAVVAPGIAEALLATGIGLVAAIPAVILYNHLSRSIASYRALVRETSEEVERLVSRDIDRRLLGRTPPSYGPRE